MVAAAEAGQPCRAVGKRFGVSVSSVVKWRQRTRATGSAAAKPMGERPALLAGQRAFILKRIAVRPDTSIRDLRAELAEAGILVSYGAVWTFLHREGLSCKKSLRASEQDRTDVARRRVRWRSYQQRMLQSEDHALAQLPLSSAR